MTAAADSSLIEDVRARLAAAADPAKAPGMQAYMKSDLPYRGVTAPGCRRIFREVLAAHPLADRAGWLATVSTLWDGATHREEWYAALALVKHKRYAGYRDADVVPLYRHLIVTGAWWDVVDDVASHLVGPLLMEHAREVRPTVLAWANDRDRWLRRTAIICQLGAKERTDLELLTTVIETNLEDPDFFLRKGIGWALRQYAWTDPAWVRTFVEKRADRMSPLSRREALKNVGAA